MLSGDFLLARASIALARPGDAVGDAGDGEVARGARPGRDHAAAVLGGGAPLAGVLPDQVVLQDGVADGVLVQVGRAALGARARLGGGGRGGEVRVPLWPRLPGHRRPPRLHRHLRHPRQADGLQDMALGLSTSPVLYGSRREARAAAAVERKFEEPGDVRAPCELVLASSGLQRTKELAEFHAQAAVDACCLAARLAAARATGSSSSATWCSRARREAPRRRNPGERNDARGCACPTGSRTLSHHPLWAVPMCVVLLCVDEFARALCVHSNVIAVGAAALPPPPPCVVFTSHVQVGLHHSPPATRRRVALGVAGHGRASARATGARADPSAPRRADTVRAAVL